MKKKLFFSLLIFLVLGYASLSKAYCQTLTPEEARKIAIKADQAEIYLYNLGTDNSFEYNGYLYAFLPDSVSTAEKLQSYLHPIFTETKTENLVRSLELITRDGKLAKVSTGFGTLERWEDASISPLTTNNKNEQIYLFQVPFGEEQDYTKYKIVFQYQKKYGWRISSKETTQ
ncbi:MAG: hypothetical protein EAZ55_02150 [Cytophagales bacterium]|nr:MAG: hypothetical protein EAZ55_02150 [Cytophagales bacterium]